MLALTGLLLFFGAPLAAERGWDWKETSTPHFRIEHQDTWLPAGLTIGVERIHFRLGMDLGEFTPWMAKERIALFIYRDLQSYVAGEFHPPAWSNGVAVYGRKAVAVPAMKETAQLLRILAHETTHLLFVSYFREARRDPPSWLNEGLAMVEEAETANRPETSQWYQSMAEMPAMNWLPLVKFLALSPTKDLHDDKAMVAQWYVQAYSVTYFLVRRHSHLQFRAFCSALREGRSSEEALKLAYHIRSVADFERLWRAWLSDPEHRKKVAALSESARTQNDGVIEKRGSGDSPFHPFKTGR
jgi:hypothetical protein